MDPRISWSEKGKRKADENRGASAGTENSSSLASRVFQSAAGLARDFASGSNGELASTLASSSAVADKSQRTNGSTAPAGWREGFNDRASSGGPSQLQTLRQNDSFRTVQSKDPTEIDFGAFITETGYQANLNMDQLQSASAWPERVLAHNGHASHTNYPRTETYVPEIHDGAEVTRLLSDPTFFAGPDPSDMTAIQDLNEQQIRDLFPQEFTETEQLVVNHIKSQLPPAPTHKPMPADHPLNLRPDERMWAEVEDLAVSIEMGLDNYFASADLRERWLSEWNDVLNGYTDEVWGELLPAVQTTRTQLEEMRTGVNNLDTKAIARLKMILGHVRQQNIPNTTHQPNYPARGLSKEGGGFEKPVFHCPWKSCNEVFESSQEQKKCESN
jgi:hypothetical protein